jgi:hypothetical protein
VLLCAAALLPDKSDVTDRASGGMTGAAAIITDQQALPAFNSAPTLLSIVELAQTFLARIALSDWCVPDVPLFALPRPKMTSD